MSTHANIAIYDEDTGVESIYVHSDGYPSYLGNMLLDNYYRVDKIEDLIDLGDASFIDKEITKPEGHSFNNRIKGHSVFYGRDRGESGTQARRYITLDDYLDDASEFTYIYNYDEDKWYFFDAYNDKVKYQPLSKAVKDTYYKYAKGGKLDGYYSKMVDKLGKDGAFTRVLKDSGFNAKNNQPKNELHHNLQAYLQVLSHLLHKFDFYQDILLIL